MGGKRVKRGGRTPSVTDRAMLHRRIMSCKLDQSLDPKSVVVDLQDRYPDYRRFPRQPLTVLVDRALQSIRRDNIMHTDNSSPDVASADPAERRLALRESEHIRRRLRTQQSASSSDESTSTSTADDDMVFETKFDPEFDVTKSILRDSYSNLAKKKPRLDGEDGVNMEIEVAVNKPKQTAAILNAGKEVTRKDNGDAGDGGKDGPRFKDLGGMEGVLEELMMEVIVPLCHPQLPKQLGVRPMAGILLCGPPGCGKTKLAHAIANETGLPFYKISATEAVSGISGASEEYIRDLFKKAYRTAPSIIFIDEIDAIASKRENLQREMERRIVTQLMTCMDELHQTLRSDDTDTEPGVAESKPGYVLVIGATNRPDSVDQALRRPGRFDREIVLGVPDENARFQILLALTCNLRLEGKFDLWKIARSTPGFVGADLAAVVNRAGNLAMKRIIDKRRSELSNEHKDKETDWWRQPWTLEETENLSINMSDFEEAAKSVQPSSRREGFSSIPNVKWEDVGGLDKLRKEFERYIVKRIKTPEDYEEFGVNLEAGFLLYGPPGCGKTLIAKAVANEAGANFIHIKGPELLNKYVGESELAVRTIFSRARTCSPCILFFDEVDALTTMRGKEGGSAVSVLNQLLIELDGADQRQGVYVIGATNRLEMMDPAVLRPGRFGKVLYVPLPNAEERGLILKALAQNKPSVDVDLEAFGRREACNNLTGADLAALVNEAAMLAMEEKQLSSRDGTSTTGPSVIKTSHFEKALEKITPSVSEKQRSYYEALSGNIMRNLSKEVTTRPCP